MPGLDLLRATAIVWVMLYHAGLFDLVPDSFAVVRFGWMGVDLFFVLSGFLIGGQIFRPMARGERLDILGFYRRRAFRTLPAYIVIVAVYFALPGVREWPTIRPLWQFLTFTENLLYDATTARSFSHVWSLCVEEQFYLVFPAAVVLLNLRPSARRVALACLAVLAGGMALRGFLWLHARGPSFDQHYFDQRYMEQIYYPTWSRLDGLLAGVVAAALRVFRPGFWAVVMARANMCLALGVAGVIGAIVFFQEQVAPFLPTVFGFPLLSASLGLIVCAGASARSLIGRWSIPGASALAAGAYSLYLSHKLAFHFVLIQAGFDPALRPVLAGVAAAGAGTLLYWLIERPFLRLRDRLDTPLLPVVQPAAE